MKPEQLVNKGMNLDVHPSLLSEGDLVYLLNGDITGKEGNQDFFVQNMLGNVLCYEFDEGFAFKGSIKLDGDEYAIFLDSVNYGEIGILNTRTCNYTSAVTGECLNFSNSVRGVYKFTKNEERTIYFVDGDNPNRYLNLDSPFPQIQSASRCDTCDVSGTGVLDCDALDINKNFIPPCTSISPNFFGQLLSGVYQVAVAYAIDDMVLTDYYLTPAVKLYSESSNINLDLEIECTDHPFEQCSIVLISNTRESGLVGYNLGFFPVFNNKITITNVENSTIINLQEILSKKPVFDSSEHIVTNGEILMIGGHGTQELLDYQPQALNIDTDWVEVKIPKKNAHLYPSFLRDETYALSIEWFGKKGNSRGVYHIPGRESNENDLLEYTGDDYVTNDIYEIIDCLPATKKRWQIENTATSGMVYDIQCDNCSGEIINKEGDMGYWESQDYTYPEDWEGVGCLPIRHHRMPSHNLTHIHDDYTIEVTTPDCYEIEIPLEGFEDFTTYEYCPSGETIIRESNCVNILAVKFSNIEHPKLSNGDYDPDISGYRILVGDRKGNKTILHKGLVFNVWEDTSTEGTNILYPNYPYNDLHGDVFLSTAETINNPEGNNFSDDFPPVYKPFANWQPPQSYLRNQFTYHSPDFHFREIKQEFGTELKVYGESVGWIEGEFQNVYLHPQTRLGIGGITSSPYTNHACQMNSVCHYSKFVSWSTDLFSRFQIQSSQFLLPVNQILSNGKKLNNYLRESSYYVELNRDLDDPTTIDTSRLLASELGYEGNDTLPKFKYNNQVLRIDNGVISDKDLMGVSYYTGIKINQPNQYGSLDSIAYRPVSCITGVYFDVNEEEIIYDSPIIYGGDVFISKHSLVRKMPIFTQWLEDVPIDTETNYRDFRNLWYPRFWYDNLTKADDQYNIDGFEDLQSGGDILAAGKFYVFVTGVLDYWCESEFIGSYREQDFTPNGSFYPKTDYNELVRTDKIRFDNKYLYNFTLLNNEVERLYQELNPVEPDSSFIVSYSLKDDLQSKSDRWLQFLPLNYTLLPKIHGKFTGMHYTDDYSIMFLFENQILYSQLNYSLSTTEGNSILLTQGDIFTNRLRKLSNESTGYVGSVDPLSFVNTRFGTYFIDRYRKKIFLWNGQLNDVTGNIQSWLHHYLNETELGYEKSVISVFDNFTENVYFTSGSRDKWTFSLKPKHQKIVGFHSFTPNAYMSASNTYLSVILTGIWKHNKEFVYQSYYGEQVPFDVGLFVNNSHQNTELQSVELFAEFATYSSYGSPIYKRDKFFDKVFAYNNNGSTGFMDVLLKNRENPLQSVVQNSDTNSPLTIEVTPLHDSIYRFNKFESIRINHDTTPLISWNSVGVVYTPTSVDATLNPIYREDLKGSWFKLHLRSEDNTNHKILLKLINPTQHIING